VPLDARPAARAPCMQRAGRKFSEIQGIDQPAARARANAVNAAGRARAAAARCASKSAMPVKKSGAALREKLSRSERGPFTIS